MGQIGTMDELTLQWTILILFGILFLAVAPYSKNAASFFSAKSSSGTQPGTWILTSSLVISWIFAKSITNGANLGQEFGFVGGFAYAIYYLSFVVAGIIIYQLREKGGFASMHDFIRLKFGRGAIILFTILIAIRLFNEVWSNTMVIGSYFGPLGSTPYYIAIAVFTVLTLLYTLKGGLRSSLLTDTIQMVFFGMLLFVLLLYIFPLSSNGMISYVASGSWQMSTGLNLALAAFLQIFSYPFHDPVMTDRGFIADSRTTLKSYLFAAPIGFLLILSFSFVGIFARFNGLAGQAPVEVGKLLGVAGMLLMNFIMVTSAASTLDSTFSSFSKLTVLDLKFNFSHPVKTGRIVMTALAIAGTLPIFLKPEILSATTISGTMVMGLAPVFLLWNKKSHRLSFHLPVLFGILLGIILAADLVPEMLIFTDGKYAALLWVNLWGLFACFLLHRLPVILYSSGSSQSY